MELDIKDYLNKEEIKEQMSNAVYDYSKKMCQEYILNDKKHYHQLFTKIIIDYISENYEEELKFNVECALKFAKLSITSKEYDGKNGAYLKLILKMMEEDKQRIKNTLLEKIKTVDEEIFIERLTDTFASALYNLKKED